MTTLLVTGAAGKLGGLVIDALRQIHVGPIIAATRDPGKLAGMGGIEARRADFDQPDTLAAAFAGVDHALLISTDAVGGDGRRVRQHQTAITAAAAAGVRHMVYTSLTRPEPGAIISIAPDHYATEQALAASGMGWTSLRDNLYADLLLEFLRPALHSGIWAAAAGDGKVGWVTRADCARTAAAVLARPPGQHLVDVTGPALVGYAEITEIGAGIIGRPIRYLPVTADQAEGGMTKAGLPPHVVRLLLSFQQATAMGELAVLSETVIAQTGIRPTSVAEFLGANASKLI